MARPATPKKRHVIIDGPTQHVMNPDIMHNFAPGWDGRMRVPVQDEYIRRRVEGMERIVGDMVASGKTNDEELAKALRAYVQIFGMHHPEEPKQRALAEAMFARGMLGRRTKE